ncbi:MAG: hypothetical protein JWO53_124 [Chlamydiia bacterium]|nr:hypothetical protein [Chlamydiia bacterium]
MISVDRACDLVVSAQRVETAVEYVKKGLQSFPRELVALIISYLAEDILKEVGYDRWKLDPSYLRTYLRDHGHTCIQLDLSSFALTSDALHWVAKCFPNISLLKLTSCTFNGQQGITERDARKYFPNRSTLRIIGIDPSAVDCGISSLSPEVNKGLVIRNEIRMIDQKIQNLGRKQRRAQETCEFPTAQALMNEMEKRSAEKEILAKQLQAMNLG